MQCEVDVGVEDYQRKQTKKAESEEPCLSLPWSEPWFYKPVSNRVYFLNFFLSPQRPIRPEPRKLAFQKLPILGSIMKMEPWSSCIGQKLKATFTHLQMGWKKGKSKDPSRLFNRYLLWWSIGEAKIKILIHDGYGGLLFQLLLSNRAEYRNICQLKQPVSG